ncbi:MAG: hypothetical protein Q9206_007112, partial [Seirophora lacunosa]
SERTHGLTSLGCRAEVAVAPVVLVSGFRARDGAVFAGVGVSGSPDCKEHLDGNDYQHGSHGDETGHGRGHEGGREEMDKCCRDEHARAKVARDEEEVVPTSNAETEDKDEGEEMKRGVISLGGMSRSTCGLIWSICPPCYLGLKKCCRNVCPDGGILQSWRWSALAYSCSVAKSWLTLEISISGLCAHIFERSDIEKDSREVLTVLRNNGRGVNGALRVESTSFRAICASADMDDLYDEFGNFIGEAEESEEESQDGAQGAGYIYDEDEEENGPANDQQLMEVDAYSHL